MSIQPGTIAEVIYKYTANNQNCMSVFHYVYTTGATTADGITATSGLLDKVKVAGSNPLMLKIADCQSQDVSYQKVSAQLIYPTRYLKFEDDFALVGTRVTPCTAQNLAAVITKQTQFAGRNAVGSLHIGGLASGDYTGGLVGSTLAANMNFVGTQMLADIDDSANGITWHPCLANKTLIPGSDPKRYEVSGSTLLYTFVRQPSLRVMRRRTVGLGI